MGNQSIHQKNSFYSYLHLLSATSSICIFFLFTSSHRFGELHCSSAIFDDPRVPREYLLAVTSGRIAVVRTKVLVSSSLSINRSNRLARFGYRFRVLALCVCRSTFASTPVFTSTFRWELFRLAQVTLAMRLAYHPQSNGQTECVNQCLEHT
jgi:hypothetical protein